MPTTGAYVSWRKAQPCDSPGFDLVANCSCAVARFAAEAQHSALDALVPLAAAPFIDALPAQGEPAQYKDTEGATRGRRQRPQLRLWEPVAELNPNRYGQPSSCRHSQSPAEPNRQQ